MILALLLACNEGGPVEAPVAPVEMADSECAVCGMILREQPSPRGQVQHRDGTHALLCSLGDLRAHLAAPSPHGAAVGVWVEALPPTFDPATNPTLPLPWIPAESASYVVGVPRPLVMGRPALSYREAAEAEAAAAVLGGRFVTWGALLQTPFSEDPSSP